ncbi:anti-sigma-D factor RsdA [Micromonospora deserti]|uniref:Anti-sigma-D factor RsdA sigma factor binding region domain-containing protein n=1 Tax=Micromonospora deserti TaxID=2070366 RepID=A0A2W2CMU9_9ACTN|nr:anti-sigma-D factor RsdA [Micromonospora deserti]PZG00766.1 hypothetical protein C1I99_09010 [Micromonospora deserti]
MTGGVPAGPPPDPVQRDDRLLDAIGRGGSPPADHPADDPLTELLTGWHAEVMARSQQLESRVEAGSAGPSATPARCTVDAAVRRRAPARPDPVGRIPAVAARPAPGWRRRRALTGATLALVTVAGAVWLGAARAEPGGLFWPVTELVYADRAESLRTEREVGRMLDQARQDLAAGRHADARHRLERAGALLGSVGDDETVTRLRGDVDELRRLLPPPAPAGPSVSGAEAGSDVPGPSVPDPAGSAAQEPTATGPASPRTPPRSTPAARSPATDPPARTSPTRPSVPAADQHPPPLPPAADDMPGNRPSARPAADPTRPAGRPGNRPAGAGTPGTSEGPDATGVTATATG